MTRKFLTEVYSSGGNDGDSDEVRQFYDAWAASYDAEITENGYASPQRCAEALAQASSDLSRPILDFGCGTGLSGLALARAGFTTIDGVDLSADMLQGATAKGLYRNLRQIEAGENPIASKGDYVAVALIGVIGIGAAPISVLDTVLAGLLPGGLVVMSLNDKVVREDPSYEATLDAHVAAKTVSMLFRENGPHLPGMNVNSTVYVMEKK